MVSRVLNAIFQMNSDGHYKMPALHALDDAAAERLWTLTHDIISQRKSLSGPIDA